MKKILIVVAVVVCAASFSYAAQGDKPIATEPAGAVVETSGVIVGKVTTVVEKSMGGGKTEGSLVLADDNGRTKIIPLDPTVKFLDATFNAVTLNQLKGKKVAVETTKTGGVVKAKKVTVIK